MKSAVPHYERLTNVSTRWAAEDNPCAPRRNAPHLHACSGRPSWCRKSGTPLYKQTTYRGVPAPVVRAHVYCTMYSAQAVRPCQGGLPASFFQGSSWPTGLWAAAFAKTPRKKGREKELRPEAWMGTPSQKRKAKHQQVADHGFSAAARGTSQAAGIIPSMMLAALNLTFPWLIGKHFSWASHGLAIAQGGMVMLPTWASAACVCVALVVALGDARYRCRYHVDLHDYGIQRICIKEYTCACGSGRVCLPAPLGTLARQS